MDLLRDLYARFRVLIHEVAKFGVVGVIAFFITLGGANLLHYGLGMDSKLSYNVANIVGIGVATIFRLYCYRRWVFLLGDEAPLSERLEPEKSGA